MCISNPSGVSVYMPNPSRVYVYYRRFNKYSAVRYDWKVYVLPIGDFLRHTACYAHTKCNTISHISHMTKILQTVT
jgi:hypothetical protein